MVFSTEEQVLKVTPRGSFSIKSPLYLTTTWAWLELSKCWVIYTQMWCNERHWPKAWNSIAMTFTESCWSENNLNRRHVTRIISSWLISVYKTPRNYSQLSILCKFHVSFTSLQVCFYRLLVDCIMWKEFQWSHLLTLICSHQSTRNR